MLGAFRVLSFSDKVGARKPAASIFRRTLAEAGYPPDVALHVGDDAVNDVARACAVGRCMPSTTCPRAARHRRRPTGSCVTSPTSRASSPA